MKKILYILLFIVGIVILYFGISAILYFSAAQDTKNVVLDGYVYDNETKEPLSGVLINIQNNTFKEEGSDYTDYSSYLGNETRTLKTDFKGYFTIQFERSAFLEITFSKEGYLKVTESEYAKRKIHKKIFLVKNETHLRESG